MDSTNGAPPSSALPHPQPAHNPSSSLADFEQHALKRTYLALLPPTQLIELCLAFESYAPLHIKGSLWPGDIRLAIASLQGSQSVLNNAAASSSSSGNVTTTEPHRTPVPPTPKEPPIMDSLREPTPPAADPPTVVPPSTSPNQNHLANGTSSNQSQPVASSSSPAIQNAAAAQSSPVPAPATPSHVAQNIASVSSPLPSHAVSQTPQTYPPPTAGIGGPYPHAPYGFAQSRPAFPHHTPYYPPPGFASQFGHPHHPYPYPPGGYSSHPSHSYATPPPQQGASSGTAAGARGSPFTTTPLSLNRNPQPPPPHPTIPPHPPSLHPQYPHGLPLPPPDPNMLTADDIPSYEDMIVEALSELGDPEGCQPKTVFSWMASHYPLHPNFRPSASQALQKAFKRGRLEKSDGEKKYRLNPSWDGATSRRHTRRPMSNGLIMQPSPMNSSPFTNVPLMHHHQPAGNSSTAFPYGARPPGSNAPGAVTYPGFPSYQPYTSSSTAGNATTTTTNGVTPGASTSTNADPTQGLISMDDEDGDEEGVGEGSDAWEAAQNILRAINFGSFFQDQGNNQPAAGDSSSGNASAVQNGVGASGDGAEKGESARNGQNAAAGPSIPSGTGAAAPSTDTNAVPPPVFAGDFTFGSIHSNTSNALGTSNAANDVNLANALATVASTSTSTATSTANATTITTVLSSEDRAALQAQLALLAAQLAEIAEDPGVDDEEDTEEGGDWARMDVDVVAVPPGPSGGTRTDATHGDAADSSMDGVETQADSSPVASAQAGSGGAVEGRGEVVEGEEELDQLQDDDESDDDMEMVPVPMHPPPYEQGLRT